MNPTRYVNDACFSLVTCLSIQLELEEIESQEGDYCETRGFLTFMDAILDVPIPPQLGHAHRTTPGFAPYLCFLVDSVFMKFDARTYTDPTEKVSHYPAIAEQEFGGQTICANVVVETHSSVGLIATLK